MFRGSAVALVTPIQNGEIDYENLGRLIDVQIAAETDAVLVCGTTGESATMSHQEHKDVVSFAMEYLADKAKSGAKTLPMLIAGAGSNSTKEAMDLTAHAKAAGAPVSLSITPYYNRPTQAGLYAHFKTIADEVGMPIILYNVPSRTGVNLEADTVVKLSEHPMIVGVKEASGNLTQISEIIRKTPEDFFVYSGDDAMTLGVVCLGGHGVISVVANLVPKDMKEMIHQAFGAKLTRARELHHKMVPLIQALFKETNPMPVKTAIKLLQGQPAFSGGPEWPDVGEVRLPLVQLSEGALANLKKALKDYGFNA